MHKLLLNQLKRKYPVKAVDSSLQPLLEAVCNAYTDHDNELILLEQSLELVSEELNERNLELKQRLLQLEKTYQQLGDSMLVLDGIFDATGEAILAFGYDNRLVRFNQTAQELLRISSETTLCANTRVLHLFCKQLKKPSKFIQELKNLKSTPETILFGMLKFKDQRLFEYHSTPQLGNQEVAGRVWCFRDVTQLKKNEALVQFQAFHDNLTGLPNRALLLDRLKHGIALSIRSDSLMAVLFIDLDHFKKVNDTEGHHVGDELLKEVTLRINSCLREHDTLARFGGDEFVVLLENIESHRIAAQTAQRIIEQLKNPFEILGKMFHISASVGVSIYPRDDVTPEELIRKADMAMYHAKDKGRSKFEFFNTALERLAHYQIALENKLRSAMHNQEMTVFFQPQVNSHGFQIERMEALLRWFPPSGNAISPADFVPVAERAGLIGELGLWVFEQVCITINKWKALGLDQLNVSVNLSGRQISDSKLVAQIKEIMLRHHIDGKQLEFEITESILMEDLEKVTLVLNQLRELNISIAIDDFGTGYSSLRYLQKLPIDILKIDRSFITDLSDDIGRQSIVNAIISLGHNLSLKIVAEGVEDKSVAEYLANKNCEYIQGFYFYKPMDAEALADLLLKQRDKY